MDRLERKIRIRARSSLCLGGVSAPTTGADKATALDPRGRPFVPATAIRGALRISAERLLRGRSLEDGGDTKVCDPQAAEVAGGSCDCSICRLFGSTTKEGAIRVGRGVLVQPSLSGAATPPLTSVRPGIAVSRRTGTVVEQKLFFTETTRPFEGLVFEALLEVCDEEIQPDDLEALRAAIRATDAIGGGRTRGLGAVELELLETATSEPAPGTASLSDDATCCVLTATALEPFHVGPNISEGFHHRTLSYVPAATLRGGVAWHLIRMGVLERGSEEIERAFTGGGSLRFNDLFPLTGASNTADPTASVTPVTLHLCKNHPHEHPPVDLLAYRILLAEGLMDRIGGGAVLTPNECLACHDRSPSILRPASWSLSFDAILSRRLLTRVALGRATGTAAESALYSMEVVEPHRLGEPERPLKLQALVDIGDPANQRLMERINGEVIRFGWGRNRGMGAMRVDVAGHKKEPGVKKAWQRVAGFNRALRTLERSLLGKAGVDTLLDRDAIYVPICLVTPFAHRDLEDHPLRDVDGVEPILEIVTWDRVGGFDQRDASKPRSKTLRTAVGRGSVFVYRIPTEGANELVGEWAKLGRRGAGEDVDQGYGSFHVAHENHQQGLAPDVGAAHDGSSGR